MTLERRATMAALVKDRDDGLLVVPGLGPTTWDLAAAGDDPRNFYLWGAMGGAAMIGLGLALAAGAWVGGQRAALLMLITMRGEWEEFNPWQVPMGAIVDPVLKLCEAEVYRVREPGEVAGIAERAVQQTFGDERIVAMVLSQQLIGRKVWTK